MHPNPNCKELLDSPRLLRRERQDLDTNLTPLIDVVFLLLTFCMAFTTFRRESDVAINLLPATAEASASRATLIEISISISSVRAINLVAFVNARLDTLVSALQRSAEQRWRRLL